MARRDALLRPHQSLLSRSAALRKALADEAENWRWWRAAAANAEDLRLSGGQAMQLRPNCQHATVRGRHGARTNPGWPVVFGLLVACGLLSSGPARALAAEPGMPGARAAQQLFARYCSQCHGLDGRGGPGRTTMPVIPDFTNRSWQQSRSNAQLTTSILEGKDRLMPANRGMVSDELARDLVAYVRTFAPAPQPAPVKVASVPPPTPAGVAGPPAVPTRTAAVPAYTPTGDFDTDFDNLAKELEYYQRQMRELASASVTAPPAAGPPDKPPAVTAPPASATPGNPAESGQEKPRVAAAPISDRPFTPDDVARGQELFLGHRPLANGGPACIACHAVNHSEARDGGLLGPELTKAYERAGGRPALSAQLWAPATRAMQSAYLQHSLEPNEVLSLVAYLEDADKRAAVDTSPLPLKFLLMSLAGIVLALAAVSTVRGSLSLRQDQATPNGSAGTALPAAPPDLAPSPLHRVGAGL